MPLEGNDWLAQTAEAALEPELPICDPHHHFWDRRDNRAPYVRYQVEELAQDLSFGHNIVSTVFIEARSMYRTSGPDALRPVGEVEYANGQAAASASGAYGPAKIAAGIVGHADLLLGSEALPVIEALEAAAPGRFRGVRDSVTWDPSPETENSTTNPKGKLSDPKFREGAKVLARRGHTLEAWLFFHQLQELADFAHAVPELTIVLNHVGALLRVAPYHTRIAEVEETWRKGIEAVAACPNVVVKLGGLGMPRFGFDWHEREKPVGSEELAAQMKPILEFCIEKFGPERGMFESNFPVDKVSFSHGIYFNACKRLSAAYSPTERAAMFHDTATRVYRLG
jgi:predicted TIM-barrel fold metal-dependent hydrolase